MCGLFERPSRKMWTICCLFARVSICNRNLRGAVLQRRCVPLTRTRRSNSRQSARVLFRRLTSSRLLLERDFLSAFNGKLYASFALCERQAHETDRPSRKHCHRPHSPQKEDVVEDKEPITAVPLMPRHDDENDEKGVLMTSRLRRQRKVMIPPWSV